MSKLPTLAALCLASAVQAQDPLADALSHRVLPGWTEQDGTYMAAIELTLASGWKTYWRAPGDAGIPPQFDWTRAKNLASVDVHWPAPKVFWQSGMRSVGYENRVVIPVSLTPRRTDRDIRLRGRMDLGVCADICVPASLQIDALLPVVGGSRTPAIVAAMAALPYTASEAGVSAAKCRLSPTEDGMAISANVTMPPAGKKEEAVIEAAVPGVWVSDAKTTRSGGTLKIQAEMIAVSQAPFAVDRSGIRITVIGSNYSVDIQGCTG